MGIIIDPEFKSIIPPLTADEYRQLEENIVAEGIRDPLVVWEVSNGDMILLDGHNRFEIAAKHNSISFDVQKLHFECREDVIIWICNHQLGRRNLSLPDKVLLEDRKRSEIAKLAKSKLGGDRKSEEFKKSSDKNSCQSIPSAEQNKINRQNKTDYKIAKAAGTSEDTVKKIRKINEKAPEKIQLIRDGKQSINSAWKEIKEQEASQPENVEEQDMETQTRKCSKCGCVLPLSFFSENRNMCRSCRESNRKSLKDVMGRVIKSTGEFSKVSDKDVIGSLYSTDERPQITFDDVADEINANLESFLFNIKRVLESKKEIVERNEQAFLGLWENVIKRVEDIMEEYK